SVIRINQSRHDWIGAGRARRSRGGTVCGGDVITVLEATDKTGEHGVRQTGGASGIVRGDRQNGAGNCEIDGSTRATIVDAVGGSEKDGERAYARIQDCAGKRVVGKHAWNAGRGIELSATEG